MELTKNIKKTIGFLNVNDMLTDEGELYMSGAVIDLENNLIKNDGDLSSVSGLLPCPFCGGRSETTKNGTTFTTKCQNNGCLASPQTEGYTLEESEEGWNKRIENNR